MYSGHLWCTAAGWLLYRCTLHCTGQATCNSVALTVGWWWFPLCQSATPVWVKTPVLWTMACFAQTSEPSSKVMTHLMIVIMMWDHQMISDTCDASEGPVQVTSQWQRQLKWKIKVILHQSDTKWRHGIPGNYHELKEKKHFIKQNNLYSKRLESPRQLKICCCN